MPETLTRVEVDRRVWGHVGQRDRRRAIMLEPRGTGPRRQCIQGCIFSAMGIPDGHLENRGTPRAVLDGEAYRYVKAAPELEALAGGYEWVSYRGRLTRNVYGRLRSLEPKYLDSPGQRMLDANDMPAEELLAKVEETEYGKRVLSKLSKRAKVKRLREALIQDAGREVGLNIVFVN